MRVSCLPSCSLGGHLGEQGSICQRSSSQAPVGAVLGFCLRPSWGIGGRLGSILGASGYFGRLKRQRR
eukprot:5191437-Pyramimonas_sp.AAC.1